LIEVFDVAPTANGNQGQELGIARAVQTHNGLCKAFQLRQRVVQDVGQPVTVADQALGDVEPELAA
jgi:hypothetical protein